MLMLRFGFQISSFMSKTHFEIAHCGLCFQFYTLIFQFSTNLRNSFSTLSYVIRESCVLALKYYGERLSFSNSTFCGTPGAAKAICVPTKLPPGVPNVPSSEVGALTEVASTSGV